MIVTVRFGGRKALSAPPECSFKGLAHQSRKKESAQDTVSVPKQAVGGKREEVKGAKAGKHPNEGRGL